MSVSWIRPYVGCWSECVPSGVTWGGSYIGHKRSNRIRSKTSYNNGNSKGFGDWQRIRMDFGQKEAPGRQGMQLCKLHRTGNGTED